MAANKTTPSKLNTATAKNHVVIIDGHAMAYRAFFAMAQQNLVNADGMPTGAIFGFFRMLIKTLKDANPSHFFVVFDPAKKNFRYDLYADYKANRQKSPDELRFQIDEIKEILSQLKIPIYLPENEEADDLIASFVEQKRQEYEKISIISGDKDLFGILYDNVEILRGLKGVSDFKQIDRKLIQTDYGFDIDKIPDYMALVGDSSDNVPGVKGIGEKTAMKLIQEFQTLENIYSQIDMVKPPGLQKKLIDDKENAFLSLQLVTLKKDLKLNFNQEDISFSSQILCDKVNIFKTKGFPNLASEIVKNFGNAPTSAEDEKSAKTAVKKKSGSDEDPSKKINSNWQMIQNLDQLDEFLNKVRKTTLLCFDTETTSVDPVSAALVGISICWKNNGKFESYYIPCYETSDENSLLYHPDYASFPAATTILEKIKPVLENPNIIKIAQNKKYDEIVLSQHGIEVVNTHYDTMVLSYLLNPNIRRHNLDDMAEDLLGHKNISYEDLTGSGKKQRPLVEIDPKLVAEYACEDAEVTYRCYEILWERVQKQDLKKVYDQMDLPLIGVLATMEKNGILIDTKFLKHLEKTYQEKIEKIQQQIYQQAGGEFNINSTKEMQFILFEKLQLQSKRKTAGGKLSTDAGTLEELRFSHPIIDLILQYRVLTKLLNTYLVTLPEYVNQKSKRIHTSFSQVTAATGRLASVDPNLQNIPIRGEDGLAIRRAFIAADGHRLLSLDYNQIELRVLAHFCEDKNLIAAYKNHQDIHDMATYLLFHRYFDISKKQWLTTPSFGHHDSLEVDKEILEAMRNTKEFNDKRSMAKILNFSIIYGVTEYGLSQNIGISRAEAKNLIELYFQNFPGIGSYMQTAVASAKEKKYSESLFGRKRAIFGLDDKNRFHREAAERLAINTPIQGSAADIIKMAMIAIDGEIRRQNLKTKLLLQIHDELIFEVPRAEEKLFLPLAKNLMETVVSLKVPLTVNGGYGENWGETKA